MSINKPRRSTEWWINDSLRKKFEDDCEKAKPLSIDQKLYLDKPISYKLLEYDINGLQISSRGSQITKSPGNLFLGCSHTYGVGHYIENSWGYKVNKKLTGRFYNFGYPGGSIGQGFLILRSLIDSGLANKDNINNIFLFYPHRARYSITIPQENGTYQIQNLNTYDGDPDIRYLSRKVKFSKKLKIILSEEINYLNYYKMYFYAILELAHQLDIPVFTYNLPSDFIIRSEGECMCKEGVEWDYKKGPHKARDGHLPVCYHEHIADKFLKMYKKNYRAKYIYQSAGRDVIEEQRRKTI